MNLVPTWKKFYRYYSNIFHTVQAASVLVWNGMPQEWKASVPTKVLFAITGVIWVLGIGGSIVNQNLRGKDNE